MNDQLDKCVWMWAGVLNYRLCDREYQCSGCSLDAVLRSPANHDLAPQRSAEPGRSRGIPTALDRFHDPQHLWLRVLPEGQIQIGLDPMAARLLESASEIHLPKVGTHLRRGSEAFRVQADGGSISFASPVTGHVLRCHSIVPGRMRRILARPYSRAWLLVVSASRLERQLSRLAFGRAAAFRLAHEWSRFQRECVGHVPGAQGGTPALPDGGEIDLDRFRPWTGSGYSALVGRWIGDGALRHARPKGSFDPERSGRPAGAIESSRER